MGTEALRNWLIDRKYGGWVGNKIPTRFAQMGANASHSADYYQLKKLFKPGAGVEIRPDDVLVDVGCGTGRIINFWLYHGCKNQLYGLELDPDIAAAAEQRLSRYPNVKIIAGNAIENLPLNGTLFFLFNPFKPVVMQAFKEQMFGLFQNQPKVRILYSYCKFLDVFKNDPNWRVQELHLKTFYPAALITINGDVERDDPRLSLQSGEGPEKKSAVQ